MTALVRKPALPVEENPVSRKLRAAVAQLGPIHLADSREAVVKRLSALLREAHGAGARFVVFPELALTTFFPRYWMTDQAEIDRYLEHDIPSPETRPLFDLAKELGIGFYLGYAELTQEKGQARHYNTSILVDPDGRIVGRYRTIQLAGHSRTTHRRPVPQDPPAGAFRASAAGAIPTPRKALFRCWQRGLPGVAHAGRG